MWKKWLWILFTNSITKRCIWWIEIYSWSNVIYWSI